MSTTLIAKRTRVGGRIDTEGDVLVEGRIEGTLNAAGCVTVGVTGVAVCDVDAGRVIVLGIVIGNIVAAERVDVAASARVVGDVRAPAVALAATGLVEGRVEEVGAAPPAPVTAPAPEAVAVAGVVSSPPVQRPTLRIRGAALVRPARPEAVPPPEPAGPAPARTTAEMGAVPRLRTRDPSVIPLPPRPPSRVRMTPPPILERVTMPPMTPDPFHAAFAVARARLFELMRTLSYERRAVTLSSGKASDFYIDSKQSILTAEGHFLVGQLLLSLIEREAPAVEAVGGLTMGADPMASAVALVSHLAGRPRAAFYVRKEPKGHGTAVWIEGLKSLRPGAPVAILEDVITTGASALRAIERARHHGLQVARVFALVDREEEGGRDAIAREAPVTSLFTRSDFFS